MPYTAYEEGKAMNFLTPLFLIGGLAIAGPLIYHLIRRSTRERTTFTSLMFLLPSPPRISKRHRLQHILLLILRCAALLLLALGFARPFFREAPLEDPTAGQPRRTVILVDTSASMRRDGAWAAARERVEAILGRAGPTDHVALFTFDRHATARVTFEEWNRTPASDRVALAASRIGAVSPSWAGTQLGTALITAAETLAETEARNETGPRQVVLVSDLQAGSRLDTLQAYEWPRGITLQVEPVKARTTTNAGVQLIAEAADASRAAAAAVRVRVSNSGDAKREQFQIGWARGAEFVGTPVEVYVPPGQNRVATVPVPKEGAPDRIVLRGDDDAFDNAVHVIPPVQQRANVLWLGNEKAGDVREPLFFLRRAFADTPRLDVQVTARPPDAALTTEELRTADLIFVAAPLGEAATTALRESVEAGKTIVAVPNADADRTLGALLGGEVPVENVQPRTYAMLAEIDFQHPLFSPFADPRYSDFTKIHVWKYRKIDVAGISAARVVAKFDSGDPAVVEVPVGRGHVFVLATGWQPDDSQLAVSSKFVPLMWSMLELSGAAGTTTTQFFVGDEVPLPAGETPARTVRMPDGANVALAADAAHFAQTAQPGIYEVNGVGKPLRWAVNLDANESRTAPLSFDELEQMGVPLAREEAAGAEARAEKAQLQAAEAENRQKLWRWLIAATLLVLLFESALAGWTARRAGSLREAEVAT